jgi:hypothetical protein
MAGMSVWGRGIGARVRGVKGRGSSDGVTARSIGNVSVAAAAAASSTMIAGAVALVVVVKGCVAEAAADGAVSVWGLCSGLGSGRSRSADVGRTGVSDCACGTVVGGVMIGTAVLGCSSTLGGGTGADMGSKLNGLLCSLGGGSGERGDMAWSFGSAGLRVGEGVISGVRVSTALVGMGGAGR